MIEIFKTNVIESEEEREAAIEVIVKKEAYYTELFKSEKRPFKIKVRYEGKSPLVVRILFTPPNGKIVAIDTSGYGKADSVTKHAFKKLRRVAKNHFIKAKNKQRGDVRNLVRIDS